MLETETDFKSPRAFFFDLVGGVRDQDYFKVLLHSAAARTQKIHACYADLLSRAQDSHETIREGLSFSQK